MLFAVFAVMERGVGSPMGVITGKKTSLRRKGIVLEQYKEPAVSRNVKELVLQKNSKSISLPPVNTLDALSPEDIIEYAEQAGVVDERDGTKLASKLRKILPLGIATIVVDAMDDEPYLSSQLGPLLKFKDEAMGGLRAMMKAIGAKESCIIVYKNLIDLEMRIPHSINGIRVKRIGGTYPAEARVGAELNVQAPYFLVGVGALIFLYRALYTGSVQTSTFITVAGNCISNPCNMEAGVGCTVQQVLEAAGIGETPSRVIVGGSMTGMPVVDTDRTKIDFTTRGVLAIKEEGKDRNYSCIGCSRCLSVCPAGLNPAFMYKCITQKQEKPLQMLAAYKCIGCATCSYICPAKLDLSSTFIQYLNKTVINQKKRG